MRAERISETPRLAKLLGKVVLVAGASSGMGRATALAMADEGADLALVARRRPELDAVAREVEARGRRALVAQADLADRLAAAEAVRAAVAHFGRLDIVIHAAGTNIPGRALAVIDPTDWDSVIATNLTAAFNVTHAVLPTIRAQRDGLIIYISSGAVQRPDVSGVAYQATKHGQVGLAHGAMQEERVNGLRTTVLFPGLTDTPIVLKRPTPTPPEVMAKALQPEDIAAACVFVATLPPRAHVPELTLLPSAL